MTHCAERGGNEAAGVKACYTHRSKALSWAPRTQTRNEGAMEKVGERGRQRQSGSDASFIE